MVFSLSLIKGSTVFIKDLKDFFSIVYYVHGIPERLTLPHHNDIIKNVYHFAVIFLIFICRIGVHVLY